MKELVAEIVAGVINRDPRSIGRAISLVENGDRAAGTILAGVQTDLVNTVVVGITGPPGAGKSSLTDAVITHLRTLGKRIGVIAIDPSSPLTGGAFLGDRVRMMRHATDPDVVLRSMATRGRLGGICGAAGAAVRIMAASGCEVICIETVGVGQSEVDVVRLADLTIMVLAPGLGDDIQAMKAGILEVADLVVVNKSDLPGADGLFMEMEDLFRNRRDAAEFEVQRVHSIISLDGKGIAGLVASVNELELCLRQSGAKERKRRENFKREVLDWSVELVKGTLSKAIASAEPSSSVDPRHYAETILRTIGPILSPSGFKDK